MMKEGETALASEDLKKGLKALCKQKGVTQRWMLQAIGSDPDHPTPMTQAEYGSAMNILMELPDAQA